MRLVGIALFTAWLLAWGVAPKGEQARPTSTVGGLAIAGSDEVAVGWLEVAHARPRSSEVLHVATIDASGHVTPQLHVDGRDDVAYRIADAGEGRFLLVSEHRTRLDRWFEVRRFGRGDGERPADLRATFNASSWEVAASGDQVLLVEEETAGGETSVHVLDLDGQWLPPAMAGRTLIGASASSLVRYEVGRHADHVTVMPSRGSPWMLEVRQPRCTPPSPPAAAPGDLPGSVPLPLLPDAKERVVGVVGLPGGYARMARLGRWLCVDGMRAGSHFALDPVPLGDVVDPRLIAGNDARLALTDANEGKGALYLRWLEGVPSGASPFAWGSRPQTLPGGDGVRGYAIFNVAATGGAALLTRAEFAETRVALQRFPIPTMASTNVSSGTVPASAPSELRLGPTRHYLPDHRPILRALLVFPLAVLGLAFARALQLSRRLRRLAPPPSADGSPLPEGPVAVEANLALDADAPAGALRLRRAGYPMLLFIEGAEVLRASDVRSRSEPRGDAVDVASGAPVVATGRLQLGALFRGEDRLHAGRGDLVLVGCTLTEARARVATRVAASAALFASAVAFALLLIR